MRARESGFTIVEMLASLVIMAMIAEMLISGISTGRRVWERTDAATEAAEVVSGAQMLLRQRLQHIYPVTRFDTMPPNVDFDGETTSIFFQAQPRVAQMPSALRRYKLWLSPRGELVLSSASDVAIDPTKPDENLVLLTGVQALDIAYYGPAPAPPGSAFTPFEPGKSLTPQPSTWQLQWAKRTEPPTLVRVHVAFEQGDRRVWPDLLVKPIVNIDTQCVFNPATGYCRGRVAP